MKDALKKAPADELLEHIVVQEKPMRYYRNGKSSLDSAVKIAMKSAMNYEGKLPADIVNMEGLSGRKYRYFINNLVEHVQSPRYLEVGSYWGSTLCSALYENQVTATAIDNWSQFGGPLNKFYANLAKYASLKNSISILNRDFRRVDYKSIGTFNIYLFDGPHEYQDQYDGLAYAMDALDNEFIYIVDDWNWDYVRSGTMDAIADLGLAVMSATDIRTTLDNSVPKIINEQSDWHNGYYIAILRKP